MVVVSSDVEIRQTTGTYYVTDWPTGTCPASTSSIVYRTSSWIYYIEGPTPEEKQVADLRHKQAIENTRKGWIEKYPPVPRPAIVPRQTPRKLMCSMSGWLASNGKKMRRGH